MAEGYINLFQNDDTSNRKPHFKGYLKIDGVDHEFALWPAKEGKKGFTGKYKPKEQREPKADAHPTRATEPPKQILDDEIPF